MNETHNTKWLPYQQASEWAQSQNIMTYDQWNARCATGLPEGIPSNPEVAYSAEFIGWHEFLGVQLSRDGRKVFWSYDRARDWARGAGVRNGSQWKKMSKDGVLPVGVPAQPYKVYQEQFANWGDFLGTGHVASKDKTFVSYEEAKAWAKKNKITSQKNWREFHKKLKPEGMPLHPDRVYKEEFSDWGSFLGTGRVANKDRIFLTCDEVIDWAKKEGICSYEEWCQRTKKDFPKNIPVSPNQVYGEAFRWAYLSGQKSKSFFGRVSKFNFQTEDFLPYNEALKWGRENGICSSSEWLDRCRSDLPIGIPAYPNKVYSEFTCWEEFLGVKKISGMSKIERMLKYVLELALQDGYTEYGQTIICGLSNKKHRVDMCFQSLRLVVEYDGAYWHKDKYDKDKGKTQDLLDAEWKVVRVRGDGLCLVQNDWDMNIDERQPAYLQIYYVIQHLIALGVDGKISCPEELKQWDANKIREINFRDILEKYDGFLSYQEASEWAKKSNIKSRVEWIKISKKGLPQNLPACPPTLYGDQFKGWGHFLGTGRFVRKKEDFVSYIQASEWAQKEVVKSATQWWKLSKEGRIPKNIPASPSNYYKDEFYKNGGWYGFLGKEMPISKKKKINYG